jgi:hypothetical protein
VVRCAPLRDVQCPASQFSSDVHPRRGRVEVRRDRRFVRASVVLCIPPGRRLRVLVLWALGPRFRLREQRGLAAVRAGRRGVPVSAMFRAG